MLDFDNPEMQQSYIIHYKPYYSGRFFKYTRMSYSWHRKICTEEVASIFLYHNNNNNRWWWWWW